MSARPRPVTATFKPSPFEYGVRPRSYSLSSGGSTESLVSVLDHDSYDDLRSTDSEAEREKEEKIEHQKPQRIQSPKSKLTRHRPKRREHSSLNGLNQTFTRLEPENGGPCGDNTPDNSHDLSCWEVWLVEKAKDERKRLKREARIKRRERDEIRKKKQIEEENKKKGEEKYKEWLEKSTLKDKLGNRQKEQQEKVKQEIKDAEKEQIERKSKEKYEKWLKEKKEKEKETKRKEKEKIAQEKEKTEEQRKRSEEAYERWRTEAQKRPRSAQHSFGYASGKLMGRCNYCVV